VTLPSLHSVVNHISTAPSQGKVLPAYVLSVGKRAAKYQEGHGSKQNCNWSSPGPGMRRRECHNMTTDELAKQLPGWGGIGIDLPVVNQTGLKGSYDFQLDVGIPSFGNEEGKAGESPALLPDDQGPTIFAALEQIGLKLSPSRFQSSKREAHGP
jgi:uncharacterized protein (TIGR03435 family)